MISIKTPCLIPSAFGAVVCLTLNLFLPALPATMANTLKQKCTLQTLNEDTGTQAVDSRKRTKTTIHNQGQERLPCGIDHLLLFLESDGPHQTSCQSFRTNMGKGGQRAQLENIECIQTQSSVRVSKLMAAATNKPLNPMAPTAIKAGNSLQYQGSPLETWCANYILYLDNY